MVYSISVLLARVCKASLPNEYFFGLQRILLWVCTVVYLVFLSFQDVKNAELALFELSRVISLEPDHPEVFEQRAEVSVFSLFILLEVIAVK